MKLSIGKQISMGIGLAAFLLLALAFVSYESSVKLVETAGWVAHTHNVLAELEALSHRIEEAEIAQRNYHITGVEHYLEPYRAANTEIDQSMSQLRALTADNPGQQRKIDRLLGLIATLRDETRQSVELRKQGRPEDSLQEVLTGSSVRTANVIYSIIGEMEQEEQRLLKQRVDQENSSAQETRVLVTAGSTFALGLVALSGLIVYRDIMRRKGAEAALRESELRYRSLIASLREGILLYDASGVIRTCNASAERILGLSADQIIGRTPIDPQWRPIHEDGRPFSDDEQPAIVTLRTGMPCTNVIMGVAKPDRSVNWISINSQPMFHEGAAEPHAVLCSFTDMTERKQAEAALRETEERFRTLVEQLPAITYVAALDPSSSTLYTSPQIETMLGFSQAEWMANHQLWREQIHPNDYARVMADVEQSQASGIPVPSEYRMLNRIGQARWFRDQAVIVRDAAGQPCFLQGIMFDITERKEAEEALHRSEARNRALLNAMPDLMFQLSRDGVYLDFKAETESDLAVRPESLVGKTIFDTLPTDVAQLIYSSIEQALHNSTIQIIEYQLILEGTPRDFEARIVVCGDNEVLAIVRDITARKNIERMKNEFISTVSHELRTPLTSIRGSLGLIAGGVAGEVPAKVQRMVDIAYKNSERLIRLINDILDIEKIESGKMIFNLHPVELLPLVEQAIEANRAYGQQFNVTFTLKNDTDTIMVLADNDRLIQALTNLLANAAKFSPPGEQVAIELSRREERVMVAISDLGPGIPESFHNQLFEKFAQADSSDTRKKGGTGLGLSITKAIIEKHGGQIDFATRPGGGTTFFMILPECSSQAARATLTAQRTRRKPTKANRAGTHTSTE